MDNTQVNELNALLKGEHMAIEAYERFIHDVEDGNLKKEFQEFQKDHKRHADDLAERIRQLGGHAELGTGLAGYIASTIITLENMRNNDAKYILKNAYDGEDKGIAKAEEIVKGDLDKKSRNLVNSILSEDHDHLRRMISLLEDIENKS